MTDERNKIIGERVRFYRTARKVSMEKLSSKLSVPISQQQMAKYETGASRWCADTICEIAHILHVDVRLLLGAESAAVINKDVAEWEAERYKCITLKLGERARKVIYRIIDGVATLQEEKP